ncbi:hypothetical protein I6B53_10235 [Schaalia sp. 19OD2882]|uniref:hypothetical protein n=1 Tax=Schaalia sp. 19OD2882 TaxID=2794089 RepID=UPI001C1ECA59|nr:hypothetical protein [Schaalia sp. 19OD2882]QWW19444.1 hypothetical protein I6B53_10235 [Schaalia sp. 19OD2882]
MALMRSYSAKELSDSMFYIVERIRMARWFGQAFDVRDSARKLRSEMTAKELRAFATNLDAHLGEGHYALEDFYEVDDEGQYDPKLTSVFRAHLRYVRGFARRAKRPWSRFTVKLVP